ncbi:hypothetical protein KQI82_12335 [Oscillibacter sp. MSJ-2]|uniref:Cell division protein ZapA n=1 Tax=Dysosmobacter acutus TaxID=2841504 RepID=A0ABS6FDQ5_9FIRM|nr:hypothetical protein [Dysosmobacter acutus]MBU5627697.1 hypothetical protein [Dysosmobacter acutus]
MPITKPQLPPRAGYVEVVNADGLHVYKPTPETARKLAEEEALKAENHALKAQISALSDQNDFQEELIVELANIVYA